MTAPDAVVTRAHMLMAEDALAEPRSGGNLRSHERAEAVAQWARTGHWPWYPHPAHRIFADTVREHERTAQSLANLEAAVRREYEGRIAELEESLEMACQNPADGCDCPGCSYAAEVNSTELETLKNG